MGFHLIRALAAAGALALLSGCSTLPPLRGTAEIDKAVAERGAPAPVWSKRDSETAERAQRLMKQPLSLESSVQLAFMQNSAIQAAYAELGIAQADVLEASRLSNPTFGYKHLSPQGGGVSEISRSLSFGFADLLLMPARSRFARAAFEETRERLGSRLLELQSEVESAWFEYVNAQQIAELRSAAGEAASGAAELAQGMHEAGNISQREWATQLAVAATARVEGAKGKAAAVHARARLAALMGVSLRDDWTVPQRLPSLPQTEVPSDKLLEHALATRMDLAAKRREVEALEDGLRTTRRWRWLGDLELGYERVNDQDGKRDGPTLALQLPLFNTNAHGVLRAHSRLELARAHLSELELGVRNEVALGLDRLASSREISESYRTSLLPLKASVVDRAQEEVNFMLIGAFDLVAAKRDQIDAYQAYLEAVRDYWLARVSLRQAAGGRLPGDEIAFEQTIGVGEVLSLEPPMDHSHHHDHGDMP